MISRAIVTAVAVATIPASLVAQRGEVYRIEISGTIEMGLAPYVERSVQEAEAAGATAIVLEIETPGGRVDAAQRIVKVLTESTIPVYAFVNTHAWSAGAMIALAADSIYMVPGSSIGAATPIYGNGEKGSEKIVSAMRGEFRALAERRGMDPRIAEAMVDEEIEVPGVVAAGKLLTLTAGEAVRLGVAASEVTNLRELLGSVGLAQTQVVTTKTNWAERLVRFLSHPVVAPILLSLGTLGLIVEVKTPSFGLAGLVGLLSFGAFFGSHLLIGLAGWEEIILLGVGVVAMGIEIFVVPGFGIAGAVAILCIASAIFLSLLGNLPTWGDFATASGMLLGSALLVTVGIIALVRMLPNSSRLQGVFLSARTDRATGHISAPERTDLIGVEGTAATDLRPAGIATIGTERLDVVTEGGFVAKGTRIRVIRSEAYRHVVETVEDKALHA
jgi:membrane-bound serine protease (ClpP class)